MRTRYAWMAGGAVALAVAVWRSQPAALRQVTLQSVAPSSPPVARVALAYGVGARPYSVILDVHGDHGGGSATITGDREQVAVPLSGMIEGSARITAALAYRIGGRLVERTQQF